MTKKSNLVRSNKAYLTVPIGVKSLYDVNELLCFAERRIDCLSKLIANEEVMLL